MSFHRILLGLALCSAVVLMVSPLTSLAQETGDLGFGVYQATGTAGSSNVAYLTFQGFLTPEFLVQGGFTFSTADANNFGFMFRGTYTFMERGDALFVGGALLDIFEVGFGNQSSTFVGFAPVVGVQYYATPELSFNLDGLPFGIGHITNNTDASFFTARLGATYWFN